MKVFVLGSTGMLGHAMCECFSKSGNIKVFAFGRRKLTNFSLNKDGNITEIFMDVFKEWEKEFKISVNDIKPDYIINCIGVVKQLVNINELDNSILINSIFVQKLNKIVNASEKTRLIHLSTDCVFSGIKGNYIEDDITDPVDIYGLTKALGEIKNSNRTLTIRTSIIGREIDRKLGLLEWILSQNFKKIRGYRNFIFSGLTTYELSNVIKDTILQKFIPGLLHISSKPISKLDLIKKICDVFSLEIEILEAQEPICDRSLNSSYFRNYFNYQINNWDQMIHDAYTKSKIYEE